MGKNYLRSSISVNALALLNIENGLLDIIVFNNLINYFSFKKQEKICYDKIMCF